MDKINSLTRKYRQASWRTQRQWLGLILLGVVGIAMVAVVYLNVSNEAISTGTEILNLNYEIARNQRKSADLRTELAELNSAENMQARADELGYEDVDPDDILYVVVPGYSGKPEFHPGGVEEQLPASIILPEYKETLFEWFADRLESSSSESGEQP